MRKNINRSAESGCKAIACRNAAYHTSHALSPWLAILFQFLPFCPFPCPIHIPAFPPTLLPLQNEDYFYQIFPRQMRFTPCLFILQTIVVINENTSNR